MVLTKKFSEFNNVTPATISDANEKVVGLESGDNMQSTRFLTWNTAGRPPTPFNGLLGLNTDLEQYEWWDSVSATWNQLPSNGDINALIARLAANTSGNGASMIGLLNQSIVTSKTVQDLANATFIAQTSNGTLENAQFLGSLTTGIVKNTTVTGVLSISASLTQIDDLSPAQGDILYYNGSAWTILPPSTAGYLLQTQGAGANPQWVFQSGTGTVTSLSAATGITLTPDPIITTGSVGLTIPVAVTSGGTGLTSTTVNQLLYSSSNDVIGGLGTVNSAVLSTNASGDPTWLGSLTDGQIIIGSTSSAPVAGSLTAGSGVTITPGAGSITISATGSGGTVTSITAGTGLTATPSTITTTGSIALTVPVGVTLGGTGLTSTTINQLLYSSSNNVIAGLSTVNSAVLITSGTGVPSISSILPSGLTIPGYATSGANSNITSLIGLTGILKAPTQISDSNSNPLLQFTTTASAVNYLDVVNNSTGNSPYILATGSDASVIFGLESKGGIVSISDSLGVSSGTLSLQNAANTNYTRLTVSTLQSTNLTLSLPGADAATTHTPLSSDGSGHLSFSTTPFLGAATATSINFGGTSLANYVEGSWTPVLTSSGGGTATYSTQIGSYTRIGNRVFFDLLLALTGLPSAGNLTITGLPLTAGYYGVCSFASSSFGSTAITMLQAYVGASTTRVDLFKYSAGTQTVLTVSDINSASEFIISGCYHL